jgi:hypothetical protein
MSELKGQLLGMLLVLSLFGVIAGVLTTSFKNAADNISEQMSAIETSYVSNS